MLFEELILRPASGAVDVPAVTAELDALPHVFRDPVEGDGWHMSATPRMMQLNREQRIARPRDFPLGIRIRVAPDHVWLAARADNDDLARALAFVAWLTRGGGWTAEVDGGAAAPVGDPRRLFPRDLPDPDTLVDDATVSPVTEGTLLDWSIPRGDVAHELAVHSSGQWRYTSGDRTLRGQLAAPARDAWNQAVAAIDTDDPELPAEPDPATAATIEVATAEGHEWVELDLAAPPAAYRPLVAMVSRWLAALDGAATPPALT